VDFDINSMTLGELEDLEDALTSMGVITPDNPFEELFAPKLDADGNPLPKPVPLKVTRAMAWIIARREDPSLTLEQTRRFTMADITGEPARPTTRTAPKSSKRGARSQSSTAGR
jgi:hypothetical protein